MLNKYVDQIYCLNLKRRPDRKERFLDRLKNVANTVDTNLTIIEAVDGSLIEELPSPWKKGGQPHEGSGAYGCLKTHVKAVQHAKDNNFNKILIFEDDVTFRPTFPEMAKNFFDNLPSNWESVFIGANFQDGPYNFNPFVARGRAFGGQSYLLKSTVYDLIIDWGNNTANAPIDVFYANQLNPRDTNYFAAPQLCSQEQGKSDIEEKDVDHRGVLGGF